MDVTIEIIPQHIIHLSDVRTIKETTMERYGLSSEVLSLHVSGDQCKLLAEIKVAQVVNLVADGTIHEKVTVVSKHTSKTLTSTDMEVLFRKM